MLRTLGTIALVTLITFLVWVFAEAESLVRSETAAEIEFAPGEGADRVVRVVDGSSQLRAQVSLRGGAAAIDRVRAVLGRPVVLTPGTNVFPADNGEHVVRLADALASMPEIRATGATIDAVEPPTVRVEVDDLLRLPGDVTLDAPGAELAAPAEFTPAAGVLLIPRRLAAGLGGGSGQRVTLVVRPGPEVLARLIPNRRETLTRQELLPPPALAGLPGVRVEPPSVDLALTIRARTETYTIPSVPVHVRLAATEVDRWSVEVAEETRFIANVRAVGPGALIERLRSGELRAIATVSLSFEELERAAADGQFIAKEATFVDGLLAGLSAPGAGPGAGAGAIPGAASAPGASPALEPVGAVRFEADSRLVRVRVTRRAPAATPADVEQPGPSPAPEPD